MEEELFALDPRAVRTPNLPAAVVLQEANDLIELCRNRVVYRALIEVGSSPRLVEELERRLVAAREAQSQWVAVRDSAKPQALIELEEQASILRSDLVAAARWSLRDDRDALASLSSITAGDSVADLVQDLFNLATLIEKRAGAFAADLSFDAADRIAEARDVGNRLSSGVSEERMPAKPTDALDLRNRAFTYLDDLVSELRTAGRYVYRREPHVARRFASRYRRRYRKSSKSGEIETQVVEEPLADAEVA